MSLTNARHIVRLEHFQTPPGVPPVFFLKIRRASDPLQCQRLVPLSLDELVALLVSIEAAMDAHTVAGVGAILEVHGAIGHA